MRCNVKLHLDSVNIKKTINICNNPRNYIILGNINPLNILNLRILSYYEDKTFLF